MRRGALTDTDPSLRPSFPSAACGLAVSVCLPSCVVQVRGGCVGWAAGFLHPCSEGGIFMSRLGHLRGVGRAAQGRAAGATRTR